MAKAVKKPVNATASNKDASSQNTIGTDSMRSRVSQADVPAHDITSALRIAKALAENYAKHPTKPLSVAQAINIKPTSSLFRMLCGASMAYGLTDGSYNTEKISLTALGKRIVSPTIEGDDLVAMREAFMKPRVIRDFMEKYNGSKLPSSSIARNVLNDIGVPLDRCADVYKLIQSGAEDLGMLQLVKNDYYVDMDAQSAQGDSQEGLDHGQSIPDTRNQDATDNTSTQQSKPSLQNDRVFITHGRNKEIVRQLKDLLIYGKYTPIVAVEQETISKAVSDKVMGDMRSCFAAIIHVGAEQDLLDSEGQRYTMLNQNVLIEIGAAMALYHNNFILLVENGVKLPSNLQGLYEVRYEGEKLDYDSTMKLLRAFNDFRS